MNDLLLEFRRKGVPQPFGVDLLRVEPLPFEDDRVALLVGEAHHLVFERGTVAGADPLDGAAVEGRKADVFPDEPMGFGRRRRKEGGEAIRRAAARVANEKGCGSGSLSWRTRREKSIVEARRRGGVPVFIRPISKPSSLSEAESDREAISPARPAGQRQSPTWIRPPRKVPVVMTTARPVEMTPVWSTTPRIRPSSHEKLLHEPLPQVEARLLFDDGFHRQAVELLVALEAGGLDGRPLGGVEEPKMDGRLVGDPSHLPAQGVDLLDELALGQTADRRVAGHQGNGIEVDVEQERFAPHPRRREGRLAARMPSPDDNDIIFPVHTLTFFWLTENLAVPQAI